MRPILVLTAVDAEARGLARHLGLPPVGGCSWPRFAAGRLTVMPVGLGAARLAERTADLPAADLVVSAGACGALDPGLGLGDLVVPDTVVAADGRRLRAAALPGLPARGSLLAVEAVVGSPADKARLWVETGARAVDMESAAVLEWAGRQGVPAAVIRGVSDTAGQALPADLVAAVDPEGRVRAGAALRAALSRPAAVADALALRRGVEAALASVAQALGGLARSLGR